MFRPLLTLLLLLNYLLVVSAGVLVSQPPKPLYTAAHPYVHSQECQRHNYLRLDCFEHCNGDQHTAQQHPSRPAPHLLALLKGLDEHCPVVAVAVLRPAPVGWRAARRYPAATRPALRAGYCGLSLRPPQPA